MCLTYCVPLADSLCSFVRVQHVFIYLFIYFGQGVGVACVHKRAIWGEGVCACMTALLHKRIIYFKKGFSERRSL